MLGACAFDIAHIKQIPVELKTDSTESEQFSLIEDVKVNVGTGYSRTLKSGTRWKCVGKIPQGNVYKTKDQILTVEASNIFEADIVVVDEQLIGFYLPVEGTFYPLDKSKKLPVNNF